MKCYKKIFNGTILLNVKIKRLIKQYKIKISCSNRREGDYKTFSLQVQLKRCKRLLNIKQRKKIDDYCKKQKLPKICIKKTSSTKTRFMYQTVQARPLTATY